MKVQQGQGRCRSGEVQEDAGEKGGQHEGLGVEEELSLMCAQCDMTWHITISTIRKLSVEGTNSIE